MSEYTAPILALVIVAGGLIFVVGRLQRTQRRETPPLHDPAVTGGFTRLSRATNLAIVLASLSLVGSAFLVGLRVTDSHGVTDDSTNNVTNPTVVLAGRATAPLPIDIAVVSIGVSGTWPSTAEALNAVESAVDAMASAGADPATRHHVMYQISSVMLGSLQIDYRIALTVPDLSQLDAVLASATGAGVTVYGVGLGSSSPDTALATARDAAMIDARTQAHQLATTSGLTLQHIDSVIEVQAQRPPSPLAIAVADPTGGTAPATMEVVVELQVTFAVE